jgi:hypothetical protein
MLPVVLHLIIMSGVQMQQEQQLISLTASTTTYYSVYAVDTNGCRSALVNVQVPVNPPLLASSVPSDTICAGEFASVFVNVLQEEMVVLIIINGTMDQMITILYVSPTTTQTYTVQKSPTTAEHLPLYESGTGICEPETQCCICSIPG